MTAAKIMATSRPLIKPAINAAIEAYKWSTVKGRMSIINAICTLRNYRSERVTNDDEEHQPVVNEILDITEHISANCKPKWMLWQQKYRIVFKPSSDNITIAAEHPD